MRYLRMMESAEVSQTAITARKAAIAATEGIADQCKYAFYDLLDLSELEEFFQGSIKAGNEILSIGDGIQSWENCAKNGRIDRFQKAIDSGEKVNYTFSYQVKISPYLLSRVNKKVGEFTREDRYLMEEKKQEILDMFRTAAARIEDMGGVIELAISCHYSKPRASSHVQKPTSVYIMSNTPAFEKWLKFDPFDGPNTRVYSIIVHMPIELDLGLERKWKSLPRVIISDFEEFCAKTNLSSSSMNELTDIIKKAMSTDDNNRINEKD